jgi:hypothetical protein
MLLCVEFGLKNKWHLFLVNGSLYLLNLVKFYMFFVVKSSLKTPKIFIHVPWYFLWYFCIDSSLVKIDKNICGVFLWFYVIFFNSLRNPCTFLIPKSCYGILTLVMRIYNVYTSDLVLFLTVWEFDLLISCFTSLVSNSLWK